MKFYVHGRAVYESTKTDDKAAAKGYLRGRLGEIATGQFFSLSAERVTIADVCQLVVEDYEENGYSSLPDVRRHVGNHIEPGLGKLRAAEFNTQHIKRYTALVRREGAQPATINREIRVLKRGFKLAHQADPPLVARIPHIPSWRRTTSDEISCRTTTTSPYLQVFLAIAYNTGVRRSEILGDCRRERLKEALRWDQVDFKAKRIYLPKTKNGEARTVPFISDMEECLAWRSMHASNSGSLQR